ncbi:hypothetical protein C806_03345 [Lachnospiraceae bacterium 3-1]|nr:hypothetical protein C806_03345 [Lachnospiraceae bacterium 3-1]
MQKCRTGFHMKKIYIIKSEDTLYKREDLAFWQGYEKDIQK